MKIKNLAVAGLVAVGAGALAVRGLVKDKELVEEAKENGKKVIDGVTEFGGTMKKAASSTIGELKDITVEKLEALKEELVENPDKYDDADSLIKDIDSLVAKIKGEKVIDTDETESDPTETLSNFFSDGDDGLPDPEGVDMMPAYVDEESDETDQDNLGEELPVNKDITLDGEADKDDTDDVEIDTDDLKGDKENE